MTYYVVKILQCFQFPKLPQFIIGAAKVQQKMHIRKQSEHFLKNNRFYLIYYSVLAQTRLKAEHLDSR
jgi:hypothetical protein